MKLTTEFRNKLPVLALVFAVLATAHSSRLGIAQKAPPAAPVQQAAAAESDPYPETPIGERSRWIANELVSGGNGFTEQSVLAYFSDEFFAERPVESWVQTFQTMALSIGKGQFHSIYASSNTVAYLRITSAAKRLHRVTIHCQATQPHRITYILLEPDPTPTFLEPPTDWDAWKTVFKDCGTLRAAEFSELSDSGPVSLVSLNPETLGNVASTHKLYTLGELARQVAAGKAKWEEPMLLQTAHIVGGSGTLQNETPGKSLTLEEWATAMIQTSDNTATDHLLNLLGRENVERMCVEMGHSDPSGIRPFLSVREFFQLVHGVPQTVRDEWRKGDEAKRRELLAGPVATRDPLSIGPKPGEIDQIGWFMSPRDMRAAMAHLRRLMDAPGMEPVRKIVAAPSGLPSLGWKSIYYKGGSTTGVLAGSFLMQSRGGKWYTFGFVVNDTGRELDGMVLSRMTRAALALGAAAADKASSSESTSDENKE